jgi:hypothetical protein
VARISAFNVSVFSFCSAPRVGCSAVYASPLQSTKIEMIRTIVSMKSTMTMRMRMHRNLAITKPNNKPNCSTKAMKTIQTIACALVFTLLAGCSSPTQCYPGARLHKDQVAVLEVNKGFLPLLDFWISGVDREVDGERLGKDWWVELLPGAHKIEVNGTFPPSWGVQEVFSCSLDYTFKAGHTYDLVTKQHGGDWRNIGNWTLSVKDTTKD